MQQTAPMANVICHVLQTSNYSLFKSINGNRNLNKTHINRIIKSMEIEYLITPILVNGEMQIIDGQHRFEAAKFLKLPIYYIVAENYGLPQVQRLNANTSNWKADDYLEGYISLGLKPYIQFKAFKDKYGFNHYDAESLLYGRTAFKRNQFYAGGLVITNENIENATKVADFILEVGKYYSGNMRRSFIGAVITANNKGIFNFAHFLLKLSKNPTMLVDCVNQPQYIKLIQDIYNYRSRADDKINLMF